MNHQNQCPIILYAHLGQIERHESKRRNIFQFYSIWTRRQYSV